MKSVVLHKSYPILVVKLVPRNGSDEWVRLVRCPKLTEG